LAQALLLFQYRIYPWTRRQCIMRTGYWRLPPLSGLMLLAPLASAGTMSWVSLKKYPDAVCVDGSPAGYYWDAAPAESPTSTWIMYLDKGGWCWSDKTCEWRCRNAPGLCGSSSYNSTMKVPEGLFSARHETLQQANKVFVPYCTSDAHMGNGEAFGRQFRGARVVEAVLTDLVQRRGLGQGIGRDFFLFGGGSAGARGAMIALDHVKTMLDTTAGNVDLMGFLDSPAWIDRDTLNSHRDSLGLQTQAVHSYANVSLSYLDPACASTFTGDDAWKCMFAEYRLPFLQTPYFMVAAQFDSFQLMVNMDHKKDRPCSGKEVEYAEGLQARTLMLIRKLASPSNAIFSPACINHVTALEDFGFKQMTSSGVVMEDALVRFLGLPPREGAGNTTDGPWVDLCSGMGCGSGCGESPQWACAGPNGILTALEFQVVMQG